MPTSASGPNPSSPFGLTDVPEAELLADLERYRPELAVTEETREVIRWIQYPPLPAT